MLSQDQIDKEIRIVELTVWVSFFQRLIDNFSNIDPETTTKLGEKMAASDAVASALKYSLNFTVETVASLFTFESPDDVDRKIYKRLIKLIHLCLYDNLQHELAYEEDVDKEKVDVKSN